MTRRRHTPAPSYRVLAKAILLASFILGCAKADAAEVSTMRYDAPPAAVRVLLMRDTTTAERARVRGDSVLAAAKCWMFTKPPTPFYQPSACPDSAEALVMVHYAPVTHATATGMTMLLEVGQTQQLMAVMIDGFLFVGPKLMPLTAPATPTSGT